MDFGLPLLELRQQRITHRFLSPLESIERLPCFSTTHGPNESPHCYGQYNLNSSNLQILQYAYARGADRDQSREVSHPIRQSMGRCAPSSSSWCMQSSNDLLESPLPPMTLATLVTAQHFRPFQPLPMLFPPVLLFSTYMNLNGYTIDSAGVTGAWSALYLILAGRRKQTFARKWGARGLIRGDGFGRRQKEEERREKGM